MSKEVTSLADMKRMHGRPQGQRSPTPCRLLRLQAQPKSHRPLPRPAIGESARMWRLVAVRHSSHLPDQLQRWRALCNILEQPKIPPPSLFPQARNRKTRWTSRWIGCQLSYSISLLKAKKHSARKSLSPPMMLSARTRGLWTTETNIGRTTSPTTVGGANLALATFERHQRHQPLGEFRLGRVAICRLANRLTSAHPTLHTFHGRLHFHDPRRDNLSL